MTTVPAKADTSTALARPDWITGPATGTEHITQADVVMPRIGIAQKLSPELDEENPRYVPGLKNGDMFNSLTHEVYGKGPLTFAILRADAPRGVEFNPLEAGGGVKDPNVALDDPRMQFGPNGEKPIATKFYDFIVLLDPQAGGDVLSRIVGLSFKSTGIKAARELNGLIKLRSAPIHAGIYTLVTTEASNKYGKFYVPKVSNAGWVSRDVYDQLTPMAAVWAEKQVTFEREPGADDEFPPADGATQM